MSDQRYSVDLIVTAQDFAECNWKSTLANEEREGYSAHINQSKSLDKLEDIVNRI